MDKENSNYAFKVVREATIRADIDAKGLSIPHTLETSGYRPDGELSKFASGKYVRWTGWSSGLPAHADGAPFSYEDFTDPTKDFFYGEWDAERSIVPIVMRFTGREMAITRFCASSFCFGTFPRT
jgi:hypothetical protein